MRAKLRGGQDPGSPLSTGPGTVPGFCSGLGFGLGTGSGLQWVEGFGPGAVLVRGPDRDLGARAPGDVTTPGVSLNKPDHGSTQDPDDPYSPQHNQGNDVQGNKDQRPGRT